MAVAFKANGTQAQSATDTTISPAYPATVDANDIAIAFMFNKGASTTTISAPGGGGWTQIHQGSNGSTQRCAIFWRRCDGSEDGATVTFTKSVDDNLLFFGMIATFSGCLTSASPIDATAASVSPNASGDDITYADFNPTETNAHVVAIGFYNDNACVAAAPGGTDPTFTNRTFVDTPTGTDGTMYMADGASSGAATGSRSHATTSAIDAISTGVMFGLIAEPTNYTMTPSPVAMSFALTTPTLTLDNTLAPNPVAMPLVVPAPTLTLDNTLAPDPVAVPFVLPDVTVLNEGGGDTSVTPDPVVLTLVVPAPTLEMGGVEATPDPVTMPLVLPDVAVALANTVSPDPTTMPLVLPDVVLVLGGVSATPDPVTMPLALPDVTLELGVTDYNMTPSPVTVAFTVPAPTLTMGGVSTTPSPVAVVFAIPVPLVQSGIFVFPDPVAMPFVVPSPSIAQALTLDPDPVTIRFVLPDVTLYLGTPPGAVGALVMDVHLVGGVVTGVELVGGLETSVRRVHGLRIYDETVGDVASAAGVTGNTWSEIQ